MDTVGGLRRASTPVDHLIAEMAALPLVSTASLELAITDISKRLADVGPQSSMPALRRWHERRSPGHATATLWRHAERDLLHAFPAVSLDELVAIRDMLWFGQPADGERELIPIGVYLTWLAEMFLQPEGSSLRPILPQGHLGRQNQQPTSAESRRTLRWLAMAIPPDLLCAAAAKGDDALELALTNATLDRMLRDGGFAETHLHLGAALSFDTVWHALVANLGSPEFRADSMSSPGADLDEGRQLAEWLVRAALVRLLLGWYLRDRMASPAAEDHSDFEAYVADHDVWRRLTGRADAACSVVAATAFEDLRRGSIEGSPASFEMMQFAYRSIARPPRRMARTGAEIAQLDPLAAIFALPTRGHLGGTVGGQTRTPEQRFVGRAMKHMDREPQDRSFAQGFWQVVRVRCLAYRHVVQRPMTPGLQWFVRFYTRADPGRTHLDWGAYLDCAAELDGLGRGLRSLEVRRTPLSTVRENSEFAIATAEWARSLSGHQDERTDSAHDDAPLEVGVVFHFTKYRGGGNEEGLPSGFWLGTNADPDARPPTPTSSGMRPPANPSGMRYSRFYLQMRGRAVALARTLQRWPRTLYVIRGLDVCTDELGVPSWVIRPLLERVRSAAELASTALDRLGHGHTPQLHTSVHAGEDFVHLSTGLRGVDEAIDHLGLREGDRLGHGIALGVDAVAWAGRVGRVAIQSEVRMWDLVWEWTWIAQEGGGTVPRHAFIQRELSRLTSAIFGEVVTPFRLEQLRDDLLDSDLLWEVGWPEGPRDRWWGTEATESSPETGRRGRLDLLCRYLTDPDIFRRGRAVEWIDPSPEAEAIEHLQDGLRRKVSSMGITVEINPTSNLLIGDLGSLTLHPMWRLDPPLGGIDVQPVSICVGSDDPLTFASTLVEEYNVLYDALMAAGLTDTAARDWLDRVRRRGMQSRFTRDPREIQPIPDLPNPLRDYPSQLI